MIRFNENYNKLQPSYLFVTIGRKVAEYQKAHPEAKLIRLGIGDVTNPLSPSIVRAFHEGVDEMADGSTFKGYGPEQGYDFLREAIAKNDYLERGAKVDADEIFVSDGATATKAQLKTWVDYAKENKALILFDAAYEAFIRDPDLPRSIYEIEGAREVAVEFRSFSKTAGFTGTRCAFTVIPKECMVYDSNSEKKSLRDLWNRRHSTKFNGVSYPVQKAAAAIYSPEGKKEVTAQVDGYLANATLIREKFTSWGFPCTGGENSPYIWIKTGKDSWEFFDFLLNKAQVVTTPGSGFGKCGEGHIRISAFNSLSNVKEALSRIEKIIK